MLEVFLSSRTRTVLDIDDINHAPAVDYVDWIFSSNAMARSLIAPCHRRGLGDEGKARGRGDAVASSRSRNTAIGVQHRRECLRIFEGQHYFDDFHWLLQNPWVLYLRTKTSYGAEYPGYFSLEKYQRGVVPDAYSVRRGSLP